MSNRLKGIFAPTIILWFYMIALGVSWGSVLRDGHPSPFVDLASRFALSLIMALWVTTDAQRRRRPLCYDHGSFVFFAWPVIVPIYLFQTRGARAVLTLLYFAGLWLVAGAVSLAIYRL